MLIGTNGCWRHLGGDDDRPEPDTEVLDQIRFGLGRAPQSTYPAAPLEQRQRVADYQPVLISIARILTVRPTVSPAKAHFLKRS